MPPLQDPNMKRWMAPVQAAPAAALVFLLASLVVAGPPRAASMAIPEVLEEAPSQSRSQSQSQSQSPLLSWNKDPKAKSFLEAMSKIDRCVADVDALYAVMRSPATKCARMNELSKGSLIGQKCCDAVRAAYWRSGVFGHLLPPVPFDEQPMYYILFLCFRRYK